MEIFFEPYYHHLFAFYYITLKCITQYTMSLKYYAIFCLFCLLKCIT
nr:MAG TPA: hypothetical protein [Inoviridae sp.]